MVGVPKSAEMRAKLSASMKAAMKTRPPWNKGKTLSAETKARMSRARSGRAAWNKGVALSEEHRKSIAAARKKSSYAASDETRLRLRLARRRPGDAIVAGGAAGSSAGEDGFPLVDTADIHEFVSLRRQLRGWSDSFAQRAGRRPSLADVRRSAASPALVRDFERYVGMRDAIRGLAADVCGAVDPDVVPGVRPGDTTASPVNNNSDRAVLVTGNGNPRLASPAEASAVADVKKKEGKWDVYDNPPAPPARFAWTVSGTVSQQKRESDRLSMNDYRLIGKYRLMGSKDIATFVHLRRELEEWSAKFRERTGRTPKLSDVRGEGETLLYSKFARYLDMRHSMHGLMKEVYGAGIDDFQTTLDKVEVQGKSVLDLLRSSGEEPAGNV